MTNIRTTAPHSPDESPTGLAQALSTANLPLVFTPMAAAKVLRDLGLTGMAECALRTRAYRHQVPFHLNGRRIVFTLADLREIAEGQARRPAPTVSHGLRPTCRTGPSSADARLTTAAKAAIGPGVPAHHTRVRPVSMRQANHDFSDHGEGPTEAMG